MPKPNKIKRGRRGKEKEKREHQTGAEDPDIEYHQEVEGDERQTKKRKREQDNGGDEKRNRRSSPDSNDAENNEIEGEGNVDKSTERPFYGMLEDQEQEYFRRADELLELNDFPSDEDRGFFLANVFREAEGKELKIACSQSCSRLMERLILLSSVEQKKKLFGVFSGNFPHLIQHRFASHCCETLFTQSAPIVSAELHSGPSLEDLDQQGAENTVYVSMENLFLYTLNELEGQIAFYLTDRFASHTLRVLLVILSGRSLEKADTKSLIQSKKKEKIEIGGTEALPTDLSTTMRPVPESFQFAVNKIISDTVATMDTSFIQVLATHPTGNPSLQILVELELTNPELKKGKDSAQKTLMSALLPDNLTTEGSQASTFINGIIYEPIGSRLLETIVTYAPGKLFKQIYRTVFRDRIAALARNEIASYSVIRVLNRLSKDDLEEAVVNIIPQIPSLVTRSRTTILKTLLERCHARNADTEPLTGAIRAAYDCDAPNLILKIASIDMEALISATNHMISGSEEETQSAPRLKATPVQLHGSLLAQTMLSIPGPPATLLQTSLLSLDPSILFRLCLFPSTSHIIQSALQSLSPSASEIPFLRKLSNMIITPVSTTIVDPIQILALSPQGSHTLDALLHTTSLFNMHTHPLFTLTERIATVIALHETLLRDSFTGRIVWRNWTMDLFIRHRGEWIKRVKEVAVEKASDRVKSQTKTKPNKGGGPEKDKLTEDAEEEKNTQKRSTNRKGNQKGGNPNVQRKDKTAIELAREKFAKGKAKNEAKKSAVATGVNSMSVIEAR